MTTTASGSFHRASRLIGTDIEDASGRNIGEIENLIIDSRTGEIAYAIVSADGRLVPAPWKVMSVRRSGDDRASVRLNVDRDVLRNAPTIRRNDVAMLGEESWTRRVNDHYRLQVRDRNFNDRNNNVDVRDRNDRERYELDRNDRNDRRWQDTHFDDQRPLQPRSYMDLYAPDENSRDRDGAIVYDRRTTDRELATIDKSQKHDKISASEKHMKTNRMISANDLLDADIETRRGEKLGEVNDLVIDNNGRVEFVVLSTGGVLGMGRKLHAMPFTIAQVQDIGRDHNMIVLDMDRERLRNAPTFDRNDWNVFLTDSRHLNDVYAFYNVSDTQRVFAYEPAQPETRDVPSRLTNSDVEAVVRNWPSGAQRAARDLVQQFGQPDEVSSNALIWHGQGFRISAGTSGNSR